MSISSDETSIHFIRNNQELSQKVDQLALEIRQLSFKMDEHLQHIHRDSAAWRASVEDEFCRLITVCTRQLSVLQEKLDRVSRREAVLQAKLKELCQKESPTQKLSESNMFIQGE